MSGLTKDFLESINVHMDDRHFELFIEHFDEALYKRIEYDIIRSLNHDQIVELGDLRNSNKDYVWQWLQANVPNLGDIVHLEVDKMLSEVIRNSEHL